MLGFRRCAGSPLRGLGMTAVVALLAATALYALTRTGPGPAAATPVAATRLVDQDGAGTSLGRLHGRLVVLNFVYTGCGRICPVQTEQLARVQRALDASLRDRVQFLSISLDPANDSPEALKRFALLHGADLANWSFVTGEPAAIDRLSVSFAARSPRALSGDHSADIRLLNPEGFVVQRYSGAPVVVGRIVEDVRQLARSKIPLQ